MGSRHSRSVSRKLRAVHDYIENQEAHHRGIDYQAELRALLAKNHIDFDEATIWL